MPTAYGYARVSSRGSDESGLSETTQRDKIQEYYRAHLLAAGVAWGETVFDGAVSGSKDFLRRPMGVKVNRRLERGDVVIVSKIDRAFRNLRDCLNVVDDWQKRGVRVVFVDMAGEDFDVTGLAGKVMLFVLGFCAEVEWIRSSERQKDNQATLRATGRPMNQNAPHGFRIGRSTKPGKGNSLPKLLYPDPQRRIDVANLVTWYEQGHSGHVIKEHLDAHGIVDAKTGEPWAYRVIIRTIKAEQHLRKLEAESAVPIDNRTTFITHDKVIIRLEDLPPWIRSQLKKELDEIDGKSGIATWADGVYSTQTSGATTPESVAE